jgi:hypothetical protein
VQQALLAVAVRVERLHSAHFVLLRVAAAALPVVRQGSRGSGTGGTIQNSSSYTGANQAYPAIWPPVGFNIAQASTSAAAASGANLGCGNGGYNGIIGGVGGMVYLRMGAVT